MKLLLIVLTIVGFSSFLEGQKTMKTAEKQFDLRAYDLAIPNYLKVLDEKPDNHLAMIKLAESYRLTNQPLDALLWYEKASENSEVFIPDVILNYAHTLKTLGLYDRAQIWYWNYNIYNPVIGEHYALSCDFAKYLLQEDDRFQISLSKYSSTNSDFGVSFYKDNLVLASFRNDPAFPAEKRNSSIVQPEGNRLFIENANKNMVKALRLPVKDQFKIGPVSYSRNGKMVAYMKNNFSDGFAQVYHEEKDLNIFIAFTELNGDFKNEKAFPYNSTEYSNAFPHLSYNGNAMYFASNREGGFGGFDLYVSYFKNGNWTEPENLGTAVNSPGNEITPFYDGDILYYSSNYLQGLGAYDVFKSKVINGEWSFAENMGKGINSPSDDYYFIRNYDSGEMYFSSNRIGGKGKDDIYIASPMYKEDITSSQLEEEKVISVPASNKLTDLVSQDEFLESTPINLELVEFAEKSMKTEMANNESERVEIATKETTPSLTVAGISLVDNASLPLDGARKISLGEIMRFESKVYFIQLAALSQSTGDIDRFRVLGELGNIYKVYQPNFTKIKLGFFSNRKEADKILNEVKRAGYIDAFITLEDMSKSTMELVTSPKELNDYQDNSFNYKNQSDYKVRLASYSDPLWFDTEKVKDLGKIEQWTKGSWTIFILSGFQNRKEAESARKNAITRGFSDAELVLDQNGIIQRIQ